jgi:hypothetical protein
LLLQSVITWLKRIDLYRDEVGDRICAARATAVTAAPDEAASEADPASKAQGEASALAGDGGGPDA